MPNRKGCFPHLPSPIATAVPMARICAAIINASSTPIVRSSTVRVNIRKETTAVVRMAPAERIAMISVKRDSPSNEWSITSAILLLGWARRDGRRRREKQAQSRKRSRVRICTRRYASLRLRIAVPWVACGGGREQGWRNVDCVSCARSGAPGYKRNLGREAGKAPARSPIQRPRISPIKPSSIMDHGARLRPAGILS